MLEALGNLGDFIGGIAVVATLIYLAVQVRQNTAALRTASRQEIVAGFREYNRLSFHPGAIRAFELGLRRDPNLSEEERGLFAAQINDHVVFFQGAYALYEAGTLEDDTYQAYLTYLAAQLATPGGAEWWGEVSPLYTPRMVSAVNERLRQGGLPDLLQMRTGFHESMA